MIVAPWILATLAAALFQTLRFALQKRLKQAGLSAVGATWARFLWSAPFLVPAVAVWLATTNASWPEQSWRFWGFALAGGIAQILATVCVVVLFTRRHFAVGITFKKSEVLQTVLVGWLLLGEGVTVAGFFAILLGLLALLILADPPKPEAIGAGAGLSRLLSPSVGLGLASGAFFALAGVGYRGAVLALGDGPVAFRAAVALMLVTLVQNFVMVTWLVLRDRAEIGRVLAAWRPGLFVGIAGMAGSLCWFIAFGLQNAAYVYAVGQVELLFSIAAGALLFHERLTRQEILGVSLLLASIVVLVLVT